MPKVLDPAAITAKWAANTKNGQKAYEAGIQAVDTSPMEAAAAKQDKYLQGVQDAVNNGTYAAGLRSVSMQDWKQQCLTKGAKRISDGVTAATPKMQQTMQQLMPQIAAISAAVRAMPDTTESDREARMIENVRRMKQIRIRKGA